MQRYVTVGVDSERVRCATLHGAHIILDAIQQVGLATLAQMENVKTNTRILNSQMNLVAHADRLACQNLVVSKRYNLTVAIYYANPFALSLVGVERNSCLVAIVECRKLRLIAEIGVKCPHANSRRALLGGDVERAAVLRERRRALDNQVCRVGQEEVCTLHIYLAHHLLRGIEITHEGLPYECHLREVHLGHRLLRP